MEEEIKQVETISVPETPVQLPKKSDLPKVVPLFILGLIILAGAVYAGVTIGKKQSPPKVIPQVIETSPTPDETANWKTYTSKYGYSMRYPPEWEVKTSDWMEGSLRYGLQSDDEVILRYSEPNQPPHGGFPYGNVLSLKIPQDNSKNLSPREWAEKILSGGEISTNFSNTAVSGVNSVVAKTIFDGINYSIFIPYKGKMYRIVNNYFSTEDKTSYYDAYFNQILSTFKFLDESSTDETANWKTYRNEKYGISFKYPSDWTEQPYELGGSTAIVGVAKEGLEIPAQVTVGVSYWDNPKNLSLDKFEEENTGPDSGMGPGVYEPNGQWIKVNGVGAYRKRQGNCEPVNCDKVVIPRGNKIFALKNYFMGDQSTFESIFNQILSTFKFLD